MCGCNVGHEWGTLIFAPQVQIPIPCVPAYIGLPVGFQGADVGALDGCPSPQISLSDLVVLTIG